jgi:hypothetical protein
MRHLSIYLFFFHANNIKLICQRILQKISEIINIRKKKSMELVKIIQGQSDLKLNSSSNNDSKSQGKDFDKNKSSVINQTTNSDSSENISDLDKNSLVINQRLSPGNQTQVMESSIPALITLATGNSNNNVFKQYGIQSILTQNSNNIYQIGSSDSPEIRQNCSQNSIQINPNQSQHLQYNLNSSNYNQFQPHQQQQQQFLQYQQIHLQQPQDFHSQHQNIIHQNMTDNDQSGDDDEDENLKNQNGIIRNPNCNKNFF